MTDDIPPEEQEAKTPIEIAFVDARLRGQVEPSPVSGMDMATFRNYLTRALEGDTDVPASILTGISAGIREHGEDAKKSDAEFWERVFWLQAVQERLREIDKLIDDYNKMAAWHHEQAAMARRMMREAGDKLEGIHTFVSDVDRILRDKENGKAFDRDKAIDLLQSRGIAVNATDDEHSLLIKLKGEKDKALQERPSWVKRYEDEQGKALNNEAAEREDLRKAEELRALRGEVAGGKHDPASEDQFASKLTDYKLDVQMKAAAIEREKADAQRAMELDTKTGTVFVSSQAGQSASEVDAFFGSADSLTDKFTTAAKAPELTLQNTPPRATPPSGPAP